MQGNRTDGSLRSNEVPGVRTTDRFPQLAARSVHCAFLREDRRGLQDEISFRLHGRSDCSRCCAAVAAHALTLHADEGTSYLASARHHAWAAARGPHGPRRLPKRQLHVLRTGLGGPHRGHPPHMRNLASGGSVPSRLQPFCQGIRWNHDPRRRNGTGCTPGAALTGGHWRPMAAQDT